MDNWEDTQKKIDQKLAKLAKGKAPDVLKKLHTKIVRKGEKDVDVEIARRVFYECLEEYQEGEYTWKEFVDQVCEALKIIK